jgi:hypothetical protein
VALAPALRTNDIGVLVRAPHKKKVTLKEADGRQLRVHYDPTRFDHRVEARGRVCMQIPGASVPCGVGGGEIW